MSNLENTLNSSVNVARRIHIESLLSSYPNITKEEQRELIKYVRTGPILDVGILTGIEAIKPQLNQFRQDHRRVLGIQPHEYLVVALIVLLFFVGCFFLWDAGLGK